MRTPSMPIPVQSLVETCIKYLIDNIEYVESFDGIDNALKQEMLSRLLKDKTKEFNLPNVLKLLNETTNHVDLSGIRMQERTVPWTQFLSRMTNLTSLQIVASMEIDDQIVELMLSSTNLRLKRFVLERSPRVTDYCLALVHKYCPSIEYLSFQDCIGISGRHLRCLSQRLVFPTLNVLNLNGCRSLVVNNIAPLVSHFPNIQTFNISKCFLSDDDAISIFKQSPPLTNLDISYNPLSLPIIESLCESPLVDTLQSINLASCRSLPQGSLSKLLLKMPKLTHLDIAECFQIQPSEFWSLTCQEPPSSVVKNISHLNLSNCKVTEETLRNLSVLGCKYTLQSLRLYNNVGVNEDILLSLVEWFPLLSYVDLYGCTETMSEEEARQFAKKVPRLSFRTNKLTHKAHTGPSL